MYDNYAVMGLIWDPGGGKVGLETIRGIGTG